MWEIYVTCDVSFKIKNKIYVLNMFNVRNIAWMYKEITLEWMLDKQHFFFLLTVEEVIRNYI